MPRIRQIKPHFLHSHSMKRVSREARLTFIRLWLLADDAGRVFDCSRRVPPERYAAWGLPSDLYPGEKETWPLVPAWLDELEREGCILRYTVDCDRYLRVVNWRKHQRISHPTKSQLPAEPAAPEGLENRSGATRESGAPTMAQAAACSASSTILANSGATLESVAKMPDGSANGGLLAGFRERLARMF